jgi:steroid delta-isomerase-like uncharacterized protein
MTSSWTHSLAALTLITFMASGCAHPSTETRSNGMTERIQGDNKRGVRRLFETFNDADLGSIDTLVGPTYVTAQGDKGPAGFKAVVMGLRAAFPDIRYTVDDLISEGDQVAVRWHWTGTHRGPFRGFPPTGKSVTTTGAGIFRMTDGKIVAAVLETDRLGFLEQIGAVPAGAGRGPRPTSPPAP